MLNNMKVLIALLVIIAAVAFGVLSNNGEVTEQQALIPEWQNDEAVMNSIDLIKLSQSNDLITLKQAGDKWVLNDGFYASIEPLFRLFQSFKAAEIVEAKTANPDNHAIVELAEGDLKIEFFSGNQLLQAIHVGKKTTDGLTFVRHADEQQTYTVKGLEPVTFNQDSWQLKTVLDIAGDQIEGITIQSEANELIVGRNADSGQWEINNMPEDHQLKASVPLDPLSNGLERLMVDGAMPVDVSTKQHVLTATYQLKVGAPIKIDLYEEADSYFMLIDSTEYPEYAEWMLQLASYKFNAFNRQLEEFIEPSSQDGNADSAETEEQSG